MFEIPLGGELSAEEDAARAELDGAAWRVMQAELGVLEQVRLLFLRIQALREQRAQQEGLRVEAQRIVEWVEQLSSAGEVDVLTLQLARMEREDVIASIQRYDIELTRTTTELLGMIGLHPMASVEPTTTASLLTAVELPEADADRVLRHPRMKAQELEYMKADGLLRLEVARQYPNPRIGPDLEYDRGDLQLGLGLILPIPLFDQNEGQIAEAVAMRQAAREQYQATLLELASEEAAARRERDASVEYLRIHREGPVVNATQAEQALADRLRSGYANVLEVLGARRAISRVRVREVELRLEVAEATLRAAVAGGFVISEDITAETEVEK
jgi:cobalt-zinc-cadmium efflux system outer membrane protein